MSNLRTLGAACALALMLAVPTFGGHIEIGVTQPTPTPSLDSATVAGMDADGVTGHIETPLASTDAVTEIALNLIADVLALI